MEEKIARLQVPEEFRNPKLKKKLVEPVGLRLREYAMIVGIILGMFFGVQLPF